MKATILSMTLLCMSLMVKAQDTIRVGHHFKAFKHLEMGTKTDIVYNTAQGKVNASLKTRTTELVQLNGREVVKITHEWNSHNEQWKGKFEYYCEPETMKPLQHIRTTERMGKEGFAFQEKKITSIASEADIANPDFKIDLSEPTYNWEIDLETYSLLPMKKGKKFVMNFYHPGGNTPPAYYQLEVLEEDEIQLADGRMLACWVIFTDYGGSQPTKFWYTKTKQNFVKMEGDFGQMKIRKTRLYE